MSSITKQVYYKNNRLQQIRGFCNSVMHGSITKAAEAMGLTQSTISLQIQSLERDLKSELFKRNKSSIKRIELTEAGRKFYGISLPILIATDDLYNQFFPTNHNTILKVAGHHSVFSIILPRALKTFKKQYPALCLQLSCLTIQEGLEKVLKDEIDLAIYPIENTDFLPKDLEFKKVADYKPALLLPLKHPLSKIPDNKITFEDIGKYNYLHTGAYAISDIMKYNIAAKTLNSNIGLENGSWDILEKLVSSGLGITIFHEDYIKDCEGLVVKKVYHLSPHIAYYAIFKKSSKIKKVVTELLKSMLMASVGCR
jgi:DNA-binding transcriptional LysR family regulator